VVIHRSRKVNKVCDSPRALVLLHALSQQVTYELVSLMLPAMDATCVHNALCGRAHNVQQQGSQRSMEFRGNSS
jgi:hypothetical protein